MPITIKREETIRLARTLKQRTGLPMARVIHQALEDSINRMERGALADDQRLAQMRAISRRIAQMPDRDSRSADAIVGYDENGLPN